jgi:hypothetical protein
LPAASRFPLSPRLLLHTPPSVSRWTSLLLAVLALSGAACHPCSSATANVSLPDGGPFRCVTAEDCPRTGNDIVCVTDIPVDYTSTCVACLNTQCARVVVSCP